MKIEIKDLGAVKRAQLDLTKKLTLFCGHNNTGKTYVSYIIYALTGGQQKKMLPRLGIENVRELIETGHLVYKLNLDALCEFRKDLTLQIKNDLDAIFGISAEQANRFFRSFSLSFQTTDEAFKAKVLAESFIDSFKGEHFLITAEKKPETLDISFSIEPQGKLKSGDMSTIQFMLLPKLYTHVSLYPVSGAIIFPVERNSIYTFSKELSIKRNILVDQMQNLSVKNIDPFDFLFRRTTRYSQPIRDGLEIAEDMSNLQKVRSEFFQFAEKIENDLLQGKVYVSNEGEVQFISSKVKSKKMPIHLTASIVKTLSSLVFYLKHIAQRGDLIIIDEPEMNLHPDNQVVLVRIFARLMNEGFRLLVSTHSDYIIREVNNLIMLSSEKKSVQELREKLQYQPDECISKEDVGVYYFDFKQKTTVEVEQLNVDSTGFEVPSIDDTIDRLNFVSDELYDAIEKGD